MITGGVNAVDQLHQAFISGSLVNSSATVNAVDQLHQVSLSGSLVNSSATVNAVDQLHQAFISGSLVNSSATVIAVDDPHIFYITGSDLRTGTITGIDGTHSSSKISGVVIGDTTSLLGGNTFVQGSILDPDDLSLTLFDSTYVNGSSGDGTYFDSTYWEPRLFNPIWIDYSIWYTPDATTEGLQGTRQRTPLNPRVGYFYANMYAPDNPGAYEIRWRYQQDAHILAEEIREPFAVTVFGLGDST